MMKRFIPVLSVFDQKLVNTKKFKSPVYIGDPINAVKIFNDKEVDEICVVDIRASKEQKPIDFKFLEKLAAQCFMPLSYGGGIRSLDDAKKLFDLGIEKVVLNSVLKQHPEVIEDIAAVYGVQSIIVSMDVQSRLFGGPGCCFVSGSSRATVDILTFAQQMEKRGAGELIVHNVDREGTFKGYDIDLLKRVNSAVQIPVIALGGARDVDDLKQAVTEGGCEAAAATSMFVFKDRNPKSILISYPTQKITSITR